MSSLIRFSFVVFLVLLQLVAPLIHAHKNDKMNIGISFHLPEFEQVNALLDNGSNMIAPSFHEGEIVTTATGNRNKKENLLDFNLAILVVALFLVIFWQCQIKNAFDKKYEPIRFLYFLNSNFARAPPLFYYH